MVSTLLAFSDVCDSETLSKSTSEKLNIHLANSNLFKVNNRNSIKRCEICAKTPERVC